MKSFHVTFEVLGSLVLHIEANTIDEARKIALDMKNTSCIKELEDAYIGEALHFEEQMPR
jgi:hypothetical protein